MYKYGKLEPLSRETLSIKQQERVKQFGEVFTPEWVVNDMLNLVPDFVHRVGGELDDNGALDVSLSKTFFEPSCGDGNFLVEVLARKLYCITKGSESCYNDVLTALSTIYAVDIQADNVLESRRRLYSVVLDFLGKDIPSCLDEKINEILYRNIVLGNTLDDRMIHMDNEGYVISHNKAESRKSIELMPGYFSDDICLINNDGTRVDTTSMLTRQVRDVSRVVFYTWKSPEWLGKAEYLIEEDVEDAGEVEEKSVSDLFSQFQSLFR